MGLAFKDALRGASPKIRTSGEREREESEREEREREERGREAATGKSYPHLADENAETPPHSSQKSFESPCRVGVQRLFGSLTERIAQPSTEDVEACLTASKWTLALATVGLIIGLVCVVASVRQQLVNLNTFCERAARALESAAWRPSAAYEWTPRWAA